MLRTDSRVALKKAGAVVTRRNYQYQKRLSSILRAASKVIARDGFEGASVRDVAAKANIGLSGIYYYFTNKDELLYALQHHTFSTLVNSLKERLKITTTPREKLRAVIDNHFEFFVNNMEDLKVCVHEIESLSGKYYKSVLTIRREYYRLVRDVVAENIGKRKQAANVASLFLFGSLNWVYMWYDPAKNSDIEKLSNQLANIFINGIKAA
ncbi:MAG: TetR/AcrR family transcriptional regulator [Candidatus Zixiibacteriota bacterium]